MLLLGVSQERGALVDIPRADLVWSGIHAEDEELDGDQGLDDKDDRKQNDGAGCVAQTRKAISCQGSAEGIQDDEGGACICSQSSMCDVLVRLITCLYDAHCCECS